MQFEINKNCKKLQTLEFFKCIYLYLKKCILKEIRMIKKLNDEALILFL